MQNPIIQSIFFFSVVVKFFFVCLFFNNSLLCISLLQYFEVYVYPEFYDCYIKNIHTPHIFMYYNGAVPSGFSQSQKGI